MNKRFSTLMATALVVGGLSSTVMAQSTNAFHFEDVKAATVSVEKAAEGNYYHSEPMIKKFIWRHALLHRCLLILACMLLLRTLLCGNLLS